MSNKWLKLLILAWLLCSVFYHFQNIYINEEQSRSANWEIFCKYLQFLEVTMVQCLAGAIMAALIIKLTKKKGFVLPKFNKNMMVTVVFGHIMGTLALNAAISMHTINAQNLFRCFEPVMVYFLSTCNGYNTRNSMQLVFCIISISTGLSMFVGHQNVVFTEWGMVASVVPLIMLPLRNVFFKSFAETCKDPVLKYLLISGYSFLVLFPVVCGKLVYTRILPFMKPSVALESISFHVVNNLISFLILDMFPAVFHSILCTFIQYTTTVLAVVYFSLSLSSRSIIGTILFTAGYLLYYQKYPHELRRFLVTSVLIVNLIFGGNQLLMNSKFNKGTDMKEKATIVHTFWVYHEPPSRDILSNMVDMYERTQADKIHVFYGTFSCLRRVRNVSNHRFSASFFTFSDFVLNTPMEEWFRANLLNKILSGNEFEEHLHEATRLALLWSQGGTFVDPFLRIRGTFSRKLQQRSDWVTKLSDDKLSGILYACRLRKRHPFVKMLATNFVRLYYELCNLKPNCERFLLSFHSYIRNAFVNFCSRNRRSCPYVVETSAQRISKDNVSLHTGTIAESFQSKQLSFGIENLAIVQFLPNIESLRKGSIATAIGTKNAGVSRAHIMPRFYDMVRCTESLTLMKNHSLKYIASLHKNAPIGCFDRRAASYLRSHKVEAFLSGGISILIKSPFEISRSARKGIYIVNLKDSLIKQLPNIIRDRAERLSVGKKGESSQRSWFKSIYVFLKKIAGASLVITEDYICASVSVALNTPVVFVQTQSTSNITQDLIPMFHRWDPMNHTLNSTRLLISRLVSGKMLAVSDLSLFMRVRATTWSAIRRHERVLESALKFGVVPFDRPPFSTAKEIVFHLIFTTSERSLISLEDETKQGKVKGSFVWRHWRCIESIFYHHPLAKVIIHSNTLDSRIFDVLRESGYKIQVKPYSLTDLAKGKYFGYAV